MRKDERLRMYETSDEEGGLLGFLASARSFWGNHKQLSARLFLKNLFAGVVCGLLTVMYAVTCASVIFGGPLESVLDVGISVYLLTAVISGLLTTLYSSFNIAIGGPDPNLIPLLHYLAISIAAKLGKLHEGLVPTVLVSIALTTALTGAALYAVGRARLGRIVQYIPTSVAAGFLAGCGYVIVDNAFALLTGEPSLRLDREAWAALDREHSYIMIVGVAIGVSILALHFTADVAGVLPGMLLLSTAAVYVILAARGMPIKVAHEAGWLLSHGGSHNFWDVWGAYDFSKVEWSVVLMQLPTSVVIWVVVFTTLLLRATGIELSCSERLEEPGDFDRELRAAGVSNMASGLAGGSIGYLLLCGTLLNKSAGATSRAAGGLAALVCLWMYTLGAHWLVYMPRAVLGGLLLYIGLLLIYDWLVKTLWELPVIDYMAVWAIHLSICILGFMPGLIIGLLIAVLIFSVKYSQIGVIAGEFSGGDPRVHVLLLRGYIFFGVAGTVVHRVRQRVMQRDDEGRPLPLRFLILDFRRVTGLDASVAYSLVKIDRLLQQYRGCGCMRMADCACPRREESVQLMLTGLSPEFDALLDSLVDRGSALRRPVLSDGLEYAKHALGSGGVASSLRKGKLMQQVLAAWVEESASSTGLSGVEAVRRVMLYMEARRWERGEDLMADETAASSLFLIETGEAVLDCAGTLELYGPGSVLGENGFYAGGDALPAGAAVVRSSRLTAYVLTQAEMQRMELEDRQMAIVLHRFLCYMLSRRLRGERSDAAAAEAM